MLGLYIAWSVHQGELAVELSVAQAQLSSFAYGDSSPNSFILKHGRKPTSLPEFLSAVVQLGSIFLRTFTYHLDTSTHSVSVTVCVKVSTEVTASLARIVVLCSAPYYFLFALCTITVLAKC